MSTPTGKHSIELNIVGDGREFLNFWDWFQAMDVVCEIRDGKLYLDNDTEPEREISIGEFLTLVKASIAARPVK